MRTLFKNGSALAAAVFVLLLASSCTPRLGWGLLLWTDQEAGLHAGTVVLVYIRSDIDKQYVIGVPGTRRKVEVPLWQLDLYRSKRAAEKSRSTFGAYLTSYLFANRDGLPVRDAPTNSGERVYRLREGQSVKILAQVAGDAVKTGSVSLAGSWYKVLTEDGTQGYVFSNTMRLYDELTESPPSVAQSTEDDTAHNVDLVFSKTWRGEYFQAMVDDGHIDLDTFNSRFGLFADAVQRQIRIELPATSQVFNYTSIAQSGQDFIFEGTPLRIRLESDSRLVADWSGNSSNESYSSPIANAPQSSSQGGGATAPISVPAAPPPAAGSAIPPAGTFPTAQGASPPAQTAPAVTPSIPPGGTTSTSAANPGTSTTSGQTTASAPGQLAAPNTTSSSSSASNSGLVSTTQAIFVVLSQDVRDVIRGEENRRINLLSSFVNAGANWMYRPESSPTPAPIAGTPAQSRLAISRGGRFLWTAIESVPPQYLGTDLGDTTNGTASGEVAVRLYLDPSLQGVWEGVLSLRFDGTRNWLDFLFRHDAGRLLLEPIASGGVHDMIVSTASNLSPLALEATR